MKDYEKPMAKFIDFSVVDIMMVDDGDEDPNLSGGVEDW